MKIALFTETYLPDINGVAAHVDTLRIGLTELGHEVIVVAADKKARRHYLEDGVLHCPSLESKKFYGFGVAPPFSHTRRALIREFGPDLIHIHHEFGVGLSGIVTAKMLGIPVVYTMHTMYDEYVHYIAPEFFSGAATSFSQKYERFVANRSTVLACPSRKGKIYFDKIGVHNKEFFLIPNSADLDAFHPDCVTSEEKLALRKSLGIPADSTIACFVGRIGQEKSVDVLLENWAQTIKPEDHLHLLVIGSGPDIDLLKNLAETLGIAEQVTFTGRVEHNIVPQYFAICDLFVTASLSEMNSISMLEGMASGLPTLQRFDEPNAEQIQVGVNGWHFHNAAEMAKHLKAVAALTPEEKQKLKMQVRTSVSNRTCKDLAKYILTIYEKAIAMKQKERPYRLRLFRK